MREKKMLLLPRYTAKGPSSRVRFYQYLPYLVEAGWHVQAEPFFNDSYIEALFTQRPINFLAVMANYAHRFQVALNSAKYDLIWMQYELLPWLPAWLEKVLLSKNAPIVIDYDDAIFHRYDQHRSVLVRFLLGNKISQVMKNATALTVGNSYLAQWAEKAKARAILYIPSVVDIRRYKVSSTPHHPFTIGWIGTPKTVCYVEMLQPVFQTLLDERTRLLIIGADVPPVLKQLPVESQPWQEESEVQQIQQFDVGIMPLRDEPFERGKCGYKLIQYMACGLPVVASPVGANQEIVEHKVNGYLATSTNEWINAIRELKDNPATASHMGKRGRAKVEAFYSLEKNAPRLITFLEQFLK